MVYRIVKAYRLFQTGLGQSHVCKSRAIAQNEIHLNEGEVFKNTFY